MRHCFSSYFICLWKANFLYPPYLSFSSMLCDMSYFNFLTNINIDHRQTLRVDYLPLLLNRLTSPLQTLPKVWLTNICFLFVSSLYTCFYNILDKVNMMRYSILSVTWSYICKKMYPGWSCYRSCWVHALLLYNPGGLWYNSGLGKI